MTTHENNNPDDAGHASEPNATASNPEQIGASEQGEATADAGDPTEAAADVADPTEAAADVADPRAATPDTTESDAAAVSTRDQVREKAEQVKARLKRNRLIQLGIAGAILVAVIVVIAVVVTNTVSSVVNKPQVNPAGLDGDGIRVSAAGATLPIAATPGAVTGGDPSTTPSPTPSPTRTSAPTDPVRIHVYVDYLSADAALFQKTNAVQLGRLITDESVVVTYHPVATMTAKSNGTKYSLRAAAAAACVASYAPDYFYAYNDELFAQQPGPDTDGMTNDQLADLAIALGAGSPEGLRACITNGTFEPWVKTVTEKATTSNLPETNAKLGEIPTVLVNGTPYVGALDNPAEFMQFIMAAESKAYYTTPSPTPSPTTTPSPSATPSGTAG